MNLMSWTLKLRLGLSGKVALNRSNHGNCRSNDGLLREKAGEQSSAETMAPSQAPDIPRIRSPVAIVAPFGEHGHHTAVPDLVG
jgi:hypothetical protein